MRVAVMDNKLFTGVNIELRKAPVVLVEMLKKSFEDVKDYCWDHNKDKNTLNIVGVFPNKTVALAHVNIIHESMHNAVETLSIMPELLN